MYETVHTLVSVEKKTSQPSKKVQFSQWASQGRQSSKLTDTQSTESSFLGKGSSGNKASYPIGTLPEHLHSIILRMPKLPENTQIQRKLVSFPH